MYLLSKGTVFLYFHSEISPKDLNSKTSGRFDGFIVSKMNVRLLIESQEQKTPDISFHCNEHSLFCEVKTISVSEAELDRYDSDDLVCNSVYSSLGEGFFEKLSSTIDRAFLTMPTSWKRFCPLPKICSSTK